MLELFKQLGVSRSDILAYEAMMDERAKHRIPNGKFSNVNEALLLVKYIAEFCEGEIRVEYPHEDAVITLECFGFEIYMDYWDTFKKLIELVDMFDVYPVLDDKIRVSFEIKNVFDM